MDITDLLNYGNFLDLSAESQAHLVALLPPTAFQTFLPSISPTHVDFPIFRSTHSTSADVDVLQMDSDTPSQAGPSAHHGYGSIFLSHEATEHSSATLDPLVFNSPFFLSASRTFQDHLFSGWFAKKAQDDLERYQQGISDGSMHADWKDEAWARDHPPAKLIGTRATDLTDLVKHGLLKQGDILAYRREFPLLKLVVEKDLLIDTIYPRTNTLSILLSAGSERRLHPTLLVAEGGEIGPGERIRTIDAIADPLALETGILDVDGRVSRADRYFTDDGNLHMHMNSSSASNSTSLGATEVTSASRAWKAFVVWRWREEMRNNIEMQALQERGGRERAGTLFYLRAYCHD
ncbi:hypothetical protein SCP_0802930 [Sparassis crispa]|uniref:ASX DEUBAD domain-containing protein n=1 Tax=Sparassis crispa TaxID=139825 RepID=A0A401GU67_9APHY|nr:hypothetical protein SCP_0802930 [Sparassis crispa]GBE85771.1 hypothetical protein SCP_0802930 [Sparassis crispa]